MTDFPTLSTGAWWPIEESQAEYADLKSPVEAGYKITRRRFTRAPRTWKMQYGAMNDSDYQVLSQLIDEQGTTGSFNWTHPITGETHEVRFVRRPKLLFKNTLWFMHCELEEV